MWFAVKLISKTLQKKLNEAGSTRWTASYICWNLARRCKHKNLSFVCHLFTAKNILNLDLFYHNQCLNKYIRKYKRKSATLATEEQEKFPVEISKTLALIHLPKFLEIIIHRGNGIASFKIGDYISDKENTTIKYQHIKQFLKNIVMTMFNSVSLNVRMSLFFQD